MDMVPIIWLSVIKNYSCNLRTEVPNEPSLLTNKFIIYTKSNQSLMRDNLVMRVGSATAVCD